MQSYFLPSHVHVCKANGHFVFLNLKEDEYSALDREQTDILEYILNERQEVDSKHTSQKQASVLGDAVAEELVTQGLLTSANASGKPFATVSIPRVTSPLIENKQCVRLEMSKSDIWRFYAACIRASYALRALTIEKVVLNTARRKRGRANRREFDPESAGTYVAKFRALRPFYHRPYLCLFDAFALVEFLALFRMQPTWVFGVQAEPFEAHCWVQEAEFAFDDDVDVIQTYTPIMAV